PVAAALSLVDAARRPAPVPVEEHHQCRISGGGAAERQAWLASDRRPATMTMVNTAKAAARPANPRHYFDVDAAELRGEAQRPPVCLYLEVTNRCNLLCTTCPRTYVELEPPAD